MVAQVLHDPVLKEAGPRPAFHVLSCPVLDNHAIDPRPRQYVGEHEARRTCADDADLGAKMHHPPSVCGRRELAGQRQSVRHRQHHELDSPVSSRMNVEGPDGGWLRSRSGIEYLPVEQGVVDDEQAARS